MKIIIYVSLIFSTFFAQSAFAQKERSDSYHEATFEYRYVRGCDNAWSSYMLKLADLAKGSRYFSILNKEVKKYDKMCQLGRKAKTVLEKREWYTAFQKIVKKHNNDIFFPFYNQTSLETRVQIHEIIFCQKESLGHYEKLAKIGISKNTKYAKKIDNLFNKLSIDLKKFCELPRETRKEMKKFDRKDKIVWNRRVVPFQEMVTKAIKSF